MARQTKNFAFGVIAFGHTKNFAFGVIAFSQTVPTLQLNESSGKMNPGKASEKGTKMYPKIPRVTTALSLLNKPSLNDWKAAVGQQSSKSIANRAAEYGTDLHAIANYVHNHQSLPEYIPPTQHNPQSTPYTSKIQADAMAYYEFFNRTFSAPIYSEQSFTATLPSNAYADRNANREDLAPTHPRNMHCEDGPPMQYTGTMDLVAETRTGKVLLCDLKTSKSIHSSHYIQLHAYYYGATSPLTTLHNKPILPTSPYANQPLKIDALCVLHIKSGQVTPYITLFDKNYLNIFFSLVTLYHQLNQAELLEEHLDKQDKQN